MITKYFVQTSLVLFGFLFILISSCQKLDYDRDNSVATIEKAKNAFNKKVLFHRNARQSQSGNYRQSLARTVVWTNAYTRNDTVYVPVLLNLDKNVINEKGGKNLDVNVWLQISPTENDYEFTMYSLFREGIQRKNLFSGKLIIEEYFGRSTSFAKVLDGKLLPHFTLDRKRSDIKIKKSLKSSKCEIVRTRVCIDAGAIQGPNCYFIEEEICTEIILPDLPPLPGMVGGPISGGGVNNGGNQQEVELPPFVDTSKTPDSLYILLEIGFKTMADYCAYKS